MPIRRCCLEIFIATPNFWASHAAFELRGATYYCTSRDWLGQTTAVTDGTKKDWPPAKLLAARGRTEFGFQHLRFSFAGVFRGREILQRLNNNRWPPTSS